MLRPLLSSIALVGTAVALAFLAARPPAPQSRETLEANYAPPGASRRFVDDRGCVVTCMPSVESDFGEVCDRLCDEVKP